MTKTDTAIRLPEPHHDDAVPLEWALLARRSARDFASGEITLAELARILWAAQGITHELGLRTAPSAGALYPLEIVVIAGDVTSLDTGTYRYDPRRHGLARLASGDRRGELAMAALAQAWIADAALVLVIVGIYRRTTDKYGTRGERYVHIEVGHVAQNIYLQATALGLATTEVGAFDDARVGSVLGLAPDEAPLAIMPIGRIRD